MPWAEELANHRVKFQVSGAPAVLPHSRKKLCLISDGINYAEGVGDLRESQSASARGSLLPPRIDSGKQVLEQSFAVLLIQF